MGREAICHCKWGNEEADCKVLLEGSELILRLGMRRRVPLSSLYPKGPNSEIKESALRELLRGHGFIDTKVASVSAKLTAIRFNKSKG